MCDDFIAMQKKEEEITDVNSDYSSIGWHTL